MPRPRKYADAAEKQRAYRRRQSWQDTTELSQEQRHWIADQLEPLVDAYAFQTAEMRRALEMLRGCAESRGD